MLLSHVIFRCTATLPEVARDPESDIFAWLAGVSRHGEVLPIRRHAFVRQSQRNYEFLQSGLQ
jgi:hypothetical protein